MSPPPAPPDVERALRLPFAAFAGAVLLHVDRAPPWCSIIALLLLAWRMAAAQGRLPLPPAVLRIALTLGLGMVTLVTFHTLNGLEAGSALLTAMGAVKLLETRSRRDGRIIVGATLFLLAAACLDRQDLLRTPLYVAEGWLVCAALTALGNPAAGATPRLALREAGRALLFALPLAACAFLLFPRLPGALWSLPGSERGTTGLADEMSPGSISELVISDNIAFRVSFEGAAPPRAERYFRGPVLHDFDGYTWRRTPAQIAPAPALRFSGVPLTYQVTLEPSGQNWWFALDTVAESPSPRVLLSFDHQLLASRPVTQPITYTARSYLDASSAGPLSRLGQRMDLQLAPGRNPRSVALAHQLRAAHPDDADFVAAVLDHFQRGGFQYTLTPPRLDYDSIDDLLFNTRLGFCGHFASAYALLMRAGGLPARIVTGYLGGEWNAVGGYYVLRQSDAHAWTEVWLEGRGWTRVDPTAVVAPGRLERGLDDLLPGQGSMVARFARGNRLLHTLSAYWDAGNQWWQTRIIGFNQRAQQSLLEHLGLPDADYGTLVLLCGVAGALWIGVLLWQLRRRPAAATQEPLARAWLDLRQALGRAGVAGLDTAGPLDLAQRAGEAFPDLAARFERAAHDYVQLRYAGAAGAASAPGAAADDRSRALAMQVRRLRARLRGRRALHALPGLPAAALVALRQQLPLYRRMPPVLRQRAAVLARGFLRRVRFEGCGGLVVTDDMRHLVAFQAALLVTNRGLGPYGSLRSVLLYPDEFVVQQRDEDAAGVVTEGSEALAGQTEDTQRILLSWADIQAGLARDDGYNVVLHEFAHLLDHRVGGELSQRPGGIGSSWHDVLEAEYARLCAALQAGAPTLIDPYAAEDPAEFFAVCTETFFGLPGALQARHPALYAELAAFYGTDPAAWEGGSFPEAGSFTR